MGKMLTFGQLKDSDLYVENAENNLDACDSREDVKVKIAKGRAQLLIINPSVGTSAFSVPDDTEVIRVYKRPFREVEINNLIIPPPWMGLTVSVCVSTLYQKTSEKAASQAVALAAKKMPKQEMLFTGEEEVIDLGKIYKVKLVTKIELDLQNAYGDER